MPEHHSAPEAAELERVAAGAARAAAAGLADHAGSDAERLVRELLAEAQSRAPLLWVVDPLESSADLPSDTPVVAVSIAAAVEGEVVAGAVFDVVRAESFSAHLGGGARRDGQPIGVSACLDLAGALVATGLSPGAEPWPHQDEIASRVRWSARDLRCSGSPALELCRLACGRLDGYYARGIAVRGYAAGALIAEEAGAVAELPCPENDDLVIAATPGVFGTLRAVVELPVA